MTDSNLPDDTQPVRDDPERAPGKTGTGGSQSDDDRVAADGPSDEPGQVGADTPGAPSSAEPMTDSTEGGLEGGDPGVEE